MFRLNSLGFWLVSAHLAFCQAVMLTTEFVTFAPGGLPPEFTAFYQTNGVVQQFRAASTGLGLPISYRGPQTFILRENKEDFAAPPEGQKAKPPLASVTLPANADNILLLCSTAADGKIRLSAIDIASGTLKDGEYRVFNFAKSTVSVIMDENRFALKPGQDTLVRNSKWHKEPLAFHIQIATVINDEAKLVYSSVWEHYPKRRNLFFLFDGTPATSPIVFTNFDAYFPPPVKATAKGNTATP